MSQKLANSEFANGINVSIRRSILKEKIKGNFRDKEALPRSAEDQQLLKIGANYGPGYQ